MSATDSLAEFAAGLEWERLPANVRARAKTHVLDLIGVACGGVGSEAARAARAAARRWGRGADATVMGCSFRLPAAGAAFANGFSARIHTFDDTYEAGMVHPGSAAVAAALASSEAARASGADFFAAVVAGYEVTARVAAAVSPQHYASGFHNTGTCNVFGAGAAAARAMGLGAAETAEVLGIAGAGAAGLRQHQITGSMADTALHGGRAAQTGVSAAELRASGLRGPGDILDGRLGFCRVMCPEPDVARLEEGLGQRFEFLRTTIKPYPSCRFTHGPIDAALGLRREHDLDARTIESVEVHGFRQSMEVSDRPDPRSRQDAILSHQYTIAEVLLSGSLTLESFDETRMRDGTLRELIGRVRALVDDDLDRLYPAHQAHRVVIRLKNGKTLEAYRDDPPGGASSPLPDALIEEKFVGLAEPVLGRAKARRVLDAVAGLERIADIRAFGALLRSRSAEARSRGPAARGLTSVERAAAKGSGATEVQDLSRSESAR